MADVARIVVLIMLRMHCIMHADLALIRTEKFSKIGLHLT